MIIPSEDEFRGGFVCIEYGGHGVAGLQFRIVLAGYVV